MFAKFVTNHLSLARSRRDSGPSPRHFRFNRHRKVWLGVSLALLSVLAQVGSSSAAPASDPFTPPLYDIRLTHDGNQPCGVVNYSSPVLADLDQDGTKEIIIGTAQNSAQDGNYPPCLVVVNANGTIRWSRVVPGSISSTAAVGDLNGDGQPDIVVGIGAGDPPATPGGAVAYDKSGNRLWYYQTLDRIDGNGLPDGVWASPAIVDLNGDGHKQVVFGGWDLRLHLLNGENGTPYAAPGNNPWPVEMLDTIWSSPAIADIDGDGHPDFAFGGDISANPAACTQDGGILRVMTNRPGVGPAPVAGFDTVFGCLAPDGSPFNVAHHGKYVDQSLYSSPVIGDFGDRGKYIVIGSGCAFPVGTNCNGQGNGKWVKIWDQHGNEVATLPTDAPIWASPALGDINGDGILDIVVPTMGLGWVDGSGQGGSLYAWSGAPGFPLLWKVKPKNWTGLTSVRMPSSPVIADVNGDLLPEILVGYVGEIVAFDHNGNQLTESAAQIRPQYPTFWLGHSAISNSPAVGDINGDGKLEIVGAGGYCDPTTGSCPTDGRVRVWSASTLLSLSPTPQGQTSASKMPWPQFRGDPTHQAFVVTRPSLAPITQSAQTVVNDTNHSQTHNLTLTIKNTSPLDFNYTMAYSAHLSGPASGTLRGYATDNLTLTVIPSGLAPGQYPLQATIYSDAGVLNGNQTATMLLVVANLNQKLFLPLIRR